MYRWLPRAHEGGDQADLKHSWSQEVFTGERGPRKKECREIWSQGNVVSSKLVSNVRAARRVEAESSHCIALHGSTEWEQVDNVREGIAIRNRCARETRAGKRRRQGNVRPRETYAAGKCTRQGNVRARDTCARETRAGKMHAPRRCTRQGNVGAREMYAPGKCTRQGNVRARDIYTPGTCTRQGRVHAREMHAPGKCTRQGNVRAREMYAPGKWMAWKHAPGRPAPGKHAPVKMKCARRGRCSDDQEQQICFS